MDDKEKGDSKKLLEGLLSKIILCFIMTHHFLRVIIVDGTKTSRFAKVII